MMQVKFFLYSAASLWKEDLTPLLVSSRCISEPRWSQTNLFDKAFSFGQNYLAVADLSHLCRPSSPYAGPFLLLLPVPLMPPSHSFADLGSPSPASLSLGHGSTLLSTSLLPTLLAVAYLSCRLQPCLLLPSSLSFALTNEPPQLGNKPEQNPKIPFNQLC